MSGFLTAGTVLGALVGVIHGVHIYRQGASNEGASPARAAYFALWAVGLWTLFGAYLLAFWILGALGLAASRLRPRTEAGR